MPAASGGHTTRMSPAGSEDEDEELAEAEATDDSAFPVAAAVGGQAVRGSTLKKFSERCVCRMGCSEWSSWEVRWPPGLLGACLVSR
jgi:hypothetical protein